MSKLDWEKANRKQQVTSGWAPRKATPIKATYNGRCCICGEAITQGEAIVNYLPQLWCHHRCADWTALPCQQY